MASVKHLLPNWWKNLLEDSEEGEDRGDSKRMLLRSGHREAMWNMAALLQHKRNGIPAQACDLLERYLEKKIRQFADRDTDPEDWEEYRLALEDRMPLVMASCIQLAAKMISNKPSHSTQLVRNNLSFVGITTNLKEIIDSEFQVFSTIGFKIPLWTSLDLAGLLVHSMGLPYELMKVAELMLEMAELKRNHLQRLLRLTANVPGTDRGFTLRNLHLSAGAVLAATCIRSNSNSQSVEMLANLTRTTGMYLRCIAYHIIVLFNLDNECKPSSDDCFGTGYVICKPR